MPSTNGNTHASPTAVTYAQALLELANEQQQPDLIDQQLQDLRKVLDTDPVFRAFLADPSLSDAERAQTLERAFRPQVAPLLMNFLLVMNEKGRLALLTQVIKAYHALLEAQVGKVEVDVTVAQRLTAEQLDQVRQRISTALNKDAVVHQYVDDSIIGGLIVRVQDKLIDASVRAQLNAMREQLLAAKPR